MLEKYRNTRIRDLIQVHPNILDVLKEYELPCETCPYQNCFVKEIPENENLSMEEEIVFMAKISEVISRKTNERRSI